MHRYITLNRSLLIALPLAALLNACGGGAAVDGATSVPTSESSESPAQEAPAQGAVPTEDGDDENAQLATSPTNLEEGEEPVTVVDDGSPDVVADGPDQINQDGAPISESGVRESYGPELDGPDFEPEAGAEGSTAQALTEGDIAQTGQALSTPRRTTLLNEAKRQYGHLKESTSYYSHTTYMNESTGTRRTDCSGYIGYALRRVLRSAYDKINNATYGTTAKAEDYFDYFKTSPTSASSNTSTPRWRRISSIKNLKPGDIIVWKNPSWMENSGHAMVVRDYPRAGRTSRNEILVPVYDSTSSPHSYNAWDSRGSSRSGIGAGTIGVKINSSGAGIAYYWTGGKSGTAVSRTIMAGRIE